MPLQQGYQCEDSCRQGQPRSEQPELESGVLANSIGTFRILNFSDKTGLDLPFCEPVDLFCF